MLNQLALILSEKEYAELQTTQLSDLSPCSILPYLIKKHIMLLIDWSGEDENYQISNFLQTRMKALGLQHMDLPIDKIYATIEKKEAMERGDHVPFILENLEKNLKKNSISISLYDAGDDTFYIALSTADNANHLRKASTQHGRFVPVKGRKTRILYTVICPDCSDMSIWELPRGAPAPQNESCEKCGKLLFDEHGRALVECIQELC